MNIITSKHLRELAGRIENSAPGAFVLAPTALHVAADQIDELNQSLVELGQRISALDSGNQHLEGRVAALTAAIEYQLRLRDITAESGP